MTTGDWFWDIDRQVAVRVDNAGRRDLLIGPYGTQSDAEIWMPSTSWASRAHRDSDGGDDDSDGDASDDWIDVNSAYD